MSDYDPTADEIEGLSWWHGLSDTGRIYWLEVAKGTVANPTPADAWAAVRTPVNLGIGSYQLFQRALVARLYRWSRERGGLTVRCRILPTPFI